MIGVAVVGTGFGQKVHIPGFQAYPHTEIVAIYNRDLDKAKAIAQSHNIPHACNAIEDIVKLPEVQAVSISTPPGEVRRGKNCVQFPPLDKGR
ncbi:hypothetical protein NUACC21_07580 [Scytonema sp. NUACC21]